MHAEEPSADKEASTPVVCDEARLLQDEFGRAIEAAARLHRAQLQAIVDGDIGANRFDLLIHEANENRLEAKYAYLSHLQKHGCSTMPHDEYSDPRRTGALS